MPKQPRLFPAPRATKPAASRVVTYTEANRECAAVILARVDAYGGEGSLPVAWARQVQAGSGKADAA